MDRSVGGAVPLLGALKVNSSVRLGVYLILGVIAISIGIGIFTSLVKSLLALIVPLAIVGGVGLIIYGLISRKPLGGGRRYLP
ncbi:MAG TPA: hypothetical protein VM328_13030 [Fimbriimonadaceae bacterium]|nr:hypothetical protein [Fimbriimonadaceae bacterium]